MYKFEMNSMNDPSVVSVDSSFDDNHDLDSVLSLESGRTIEQHPMMNEAIKPIEIVRNETAAVNVVKTVFVASLLSVAIAFSVATFFFVREGESKNLEIHFDDYASRIVHAFYHGMALRIWTANALSVAFTSFLQHSNTTWPHVTIPDFEAQTNGALRVAQASYISFAPLVTNETRSSWEAYAVRSAANLTGSNSTYSSYDEKDGSLIQDKAQNTTNRKTRTVADGVYRLDGASMVNDNGSGPFSPIWQITPFSEYAKLVMFNQLSESTQEAAIEAMLLARDSVVSGVSFTDPYFISIDDQTIHPRSVVVSPVFDDIVSRNIVGSISIAFEWELSFSETLPVHVGGLVIVIFNSCGQEFTFEILGCKAIFLGEGDLHDDKFNSIFQQSMPERFEEILQTGIGLRKTRSNATSTDQAVSGCQYGVRVYPSENMKREYETEKPTHYTLVVACIFAVNALAFIVYDCLVERRQTVLLTAASRSSAIVHSLFPDFVRERMLHSTTAENQSEIAKKSTVATWRTQPPIPIRRSSVRSIGSETPNIGFQHFLCNGGRRVDLTATPIAELFPDTTIMFADIAGFTAWSSEREPSQVFELLETIYRAFDARAKKLGVFKVETIGDCYVAVTGLPEPNKDHAVTMARFARDCMVRMSSITRQLETSLGPGTGELALRVGLHSGPVTAGVLRGEKSRFQLFGDTMNTASRMESTGLKNMIQVSSETADRLVAANKEYWLVPREERVVAKGKGEMQTFWVKPTRRSTAGSLPSTDMTSYPSMVEANGRSMAWGDMALELGIANQTNEQQRRVRLIHWNVEILYSLLSKVASQRSRSSLNRSSIKSMNSKQAADSSHQYHNIIDEVKDIIEFPKFDPTAPSQQLDTLVPMDEEVRDQLRDYVTQIAHLYRDVPFHNFDHASHVTMSANKLMRRIIAVHSFDATKNDNESETAGTSAFHRHLSTFGISSDPLMHFAVVFSALIHDVDHTGVTNAQLVNEQAPVAIKFKNKSVAEQNSVSVAWELLTEHRFEALMTCICATDEERTRFRQLVVNTVMATDIIDGELRAIRKAKWDKAFCEPSLMALGGDDCSMVVESQGATATSASDERLDRKATIVMEHIIQASDVAHCMQHWHVFCKWNQRLFNEIHLAFLNGRAESDPSIDWYENQLSFFDNYIIPLAKKLKECGVFTVYGDEYLKYALENRKEWEQKGKEVSRKMLTTAANVVSEQLDHGHQWGQWGQ